MDLAGNARLLVLYKLFVKHVRKGCSELDPKYVFNSARDIPRSVLVDIEPKYAQLLHSLFNTSLQAFERYVDANGIAELCRALEQRKIQHDVVELTEADQESADLLLSVFAGNGATFTHSPQALQASNEAAKLKISQLKRSGAALTAHLGALKQRISVLSKECLNKVL